MNEEMMKCKCEKRQKRKKLKRWKRVNVKLVTKREEIVLRSELNLCVNGKLRRNVIAKQSVHLDSWLPDENDRCCQTKSCAFNFDLNQIEK